MKIKPFGILPAMFMLILSVGLVNHVLVVPLLLDVAKRDAWISVLAELAIVLPWVLLPIYGTLKRMNGMAIDKWLAEYIPRWLAAFLIGMLLLVQLCTALETLITTASWTATTYLPNTPSIVVCTVFLGLCMFASISGLRVIAYVSCILLPIVVLLGDFVMSANMPHKDYHYLLPMLERGPMPVLHGVLFCVTSSCELFGLLFIQHHVKGTFKRWHFIVLVLFLALLTIGPVTGAITQFGPEEAEDLRYPAFSQWRLVSIGKYFEHVDFFAIYQWMSGALIRISLSIHILSEFGPMRRLRRKWLSSAVLGVLILIASGIGINHMIFIKELFMVYFQHVGVFVIALTSIIWFVSFFKKGKRAKGNTRIAINGSEEAEQT
ncbi:spore germination protein (amino acid permease) [Paenibacillus endophyticus]|uniref:Spore germination protein (Amino acid permease) n=1 Tax=Paenibacillus endophyticus TaxID=1294268 RepID=A0A7W5C2V8_9BACL|nr:endospore germination permease [Paenibacillus endophyticus]MBB3149998.1 spore germination protein (amino acid permease) [Paenibacillus endophyticus]